MKKYLRPLVWWAYSAIAVTGVFGAIYLAVQQDYRQSANDPQIAMAEDAVTQLADGANIVSIVTRNAPLLNIKTTLLPWIAVYDAQGNVINASGQLDEHLPQLPVGVFDTLNNEERFTWQPASPGTLSLGGPAPNVRQAVVVVHFHNPHAVNGELATGSVAVGRSLSLTEERVEQLGINLALAWAFTLGCLLIASFVMDWVLKSCI